MQTVIGQINPADTSLRNQQLGAGCSADAGPAVVPVYRPEMTAGLSES